MERARDRTEKKSSTLVLWRKRMEVVRRNRLLYGVYL